MRIILTEVETRVFENTVELLTGPGVNEEMTRRALENLYELAHSKGRLDGISLVSELINQKP